MVGIADRTYPLKQAPNYKAPVPRWTLILPKEVTHIYTVYLGVQDHGGNRDAASEAEQSIQKILDQDEARPLAIDTFRVTDGFDLVHSRVWVAYWTDGDDFVTKINSIKLVDMWSGLGDGRRSIGIWCEQFITPIDRLETNYARLEHKPGLSQIKGSWQVGHNRTAYWGAGRDRMPASAYDLFDKPENISPPSAPPRGIGEHLIGTNYDNMCHIRSGQYWVTCDEVERDAYENGLQETLMAGMHYLFEHPEETGTIGLRFLQNLDENGKPRRETCGAGFHRNWADLENWSSRHKSHLKIFNGSQKHAKDFGEERKFMTWHEVSILKAGEARFEYVNCDPKTGVIKWVPLEREGLSL